VEDDPGPFAAALRGSEAARPANAVASTLSDAAAADQNARLQVLVDRFKNEAGGRTVVGALPVHVTFPQFGPSVFLASELTAESNAPSIGLTFRRM
jgi:hypothetical protein